MARIAQIPANTATADCKRSEASRSCVAVVATNSTRAPVSRQAAARANLENLLEGSKGDLAKTDASLFILPPLDNAQAIPESYGAPDRLPTFWASVEGGLGRDAQTSQGKHLNLSAHTR